MSKDKTVGRNRNMSMHPDDVAARSFNSSIKLPPLPETDDSLAPSRSSTVGNFDPASSRPTFNLGAANEEHTTVSSVLSEPKPAAVERRTMGTGISGVNIPRENRKEVPAGWLRLDLPSRFIPYDFDELLVRSFNVPDLINLATAQNEGSFSAILDVIDGCVSEDIRNLTYSDYRFIMYWIRLNSYQKSPYKLPWTSRYGNVNNLVIKSTDLEIIELAMTKEEYTEFKDKGIRFPTVRDAEMITEDLDYKTRFTLERAQYIYIPEGGDISAVGRVEALSKCGIETLEDIRDFAGKIDHGVKESAEVVDEQFEPKAAMEYLTTTAANIIALAEHAQEELILNNRSPLDVLALTTRAQNMQEEAEEIEIKLENNEPVLPRKEVVQLDISVLSFFPEI